MLCPSILLVKHMDDTHAAGHGNDDVAYVLVLPQQGGVLVEQR